MEAPKRAVELSIKLGGNTDDHVIAALENLATDFSLHGVRSMASGSPSSGFSVTVERDSTITKEVYFKNVANYLEEKKIDMDVYDKKAEAVAEEYAKEKENL